MTKHEFRLKCREAMKANNALGNTSCRGLPMCMIRTNYQYEGFTKKGCSFACCKCGKCTTTLTCDIAKFPKSAPWKGPAKYLRAAYTNTELIRHADRYVTDWQGDPPSDDKIPELFVSKKIIKQFKGKWSIGKLPTPKKNEWVEEIGGAWVALRDCHIEGNIVLNTTGNYYPICTTTKGQIKSIVRGTTDMPHRWAGTKVLTHLIAIGLKKGEALVIGTYRLNPNRSVIEGSVALNIGAPEDESERDVVNDLAGKDPLDTLAQNVLEEAVEVPIADATAAWCRSQAKKLHTLTGVFEEGFYALLNIHSGSSAAQKKEVRGLGKTVWALPLKTIRKVLAADKTDLELYQDGLYTCGDFSLSLKARLADTYGINFVTLVCDTSALHAYCAILSVYRGKLKWVFIEPQTDRIIAGGARVPHYRMQKGVALIATSKV